MVEQYLEQLGQYLVTPEALVLGLGLLAIIIFYLKKPEPQEQVMPSINFFMEDKADGKLNSVLRRLKNNIFLILHLSILTMLVLAVAEPFEWQEGEQENRILVLDNSANSQNQLQNHKNYLKNNLGESNTLITSNNDIIGEDLTTREATSIINELETNYNEPRLVETLRTAREYDGEIIIASTFGGVPKNQIQQEINSLNQPIKYTEPDFQNQQGIIDIEKTNSGEAQITVRNYQEQRNIQFIHNNLEYDIEVSADSTELLEIELAEGTNKVELENDNYGWDNSAYIEYIPERNEVAYISQEHSSHVETALSVQNSIETVQKTETLPDETDLVVTENEKIDTDSPQIVLKPEKDYLNDEKTSETVLKNDNVNLGNITFQESRINVDGLTDPEEVLYRSQDSEDVIYLNYRDNRLRNLPVYPLIWREAIEDLLETPEPFYKSANVDQTPGVDEDGRHVNLMQEITPFDEDLEQPSYTGLGEIKNSYQNPLIAAALLLILIEVGLLRKRGVI